MERQHGLNNQLQSLFRSHPQMNAGYLGWHSYSAEISRNQVPVPMICGTSLTGGKNKEKIINLK